MPTKIGLPINNIYLKHIIEKITKKEVIISSNESNKLGELYSPKYTCSLFKYTLGTYIECLRKDANIIIEAISDCQNSVFSELQLVILNDLGFHFTFEKINKSGHISLIKLYKFAKKMNPKLNYVKYLHYLIQETIIIIFIDKFEKHCQKNQILNQENYIVLLEKLKEIYLNKELSTYEIIKEYFKHKKSIPIKKENNHQITTVLIIEETTFEIASDIKTELEGHLLSRDVLPYSYKYLRHQLFLSIFTSLQSNETKKYLKHSPANELLYYIIKACHRDIDGIIYIKTADCPRNVNIMPTINKLCNKYRRPIIYLTEKASIDKQIDGFCIQIKQNKKQYKLIKKSIK